MPGLTLFPRTAAEKDCACGNRVRQSGSSYRLPTRQNSTLAGASFSSALKWGGWTRIENGADAKQSTMDASQRALESAGVEFTNGEQPGVRMTKAAAAHSADA